MAGEPGPFRLIIDPVAQATCDNLQKTDLGKWKKVNKALQLLKSNPRHPSLQAHKWGTLKGRAPGGQDYFTAYVENNTPSAWRIFFYYDPNERGVIKIASIEPHR